MKKLFSPYSIALATVTIALLARILIFKVSGGLLVVAIAEPVVILALGILSRKYWARAQQREGELQLEHAQVLALQGENAALSDRFLVLQEQDSIRGDLVENIVHSLGTKLAVIRTASELLGREELSDGGRTYLVALKTQAKTARKLIADLLKAARLEAGAIELRIDTINLGEWLPAIVAAQRPEAIEREQDLICATEPKMPPLLTDASILEDVISELVLNALKYSRSGSEIKVEARFDKGRDRHIIEVINPGFILSRERELIWNRFYRITGGASATRTGDGLGLFLVRQQVALLKGEVRVSAKAREQVVIFKVEL